MTMTVFSDFWGASQRSLTAVGTFLDIGACSPGPDVIDTENLIIALMDNSCVQNVLVSGFHLIFIVTLIALTLFHRPNTNSISSRNSPSSPRSFLEWSCFLSASAVSLFSFGVTTSLLVSAWVNERRIPMFQCIFYLVHAVAWFCLAFTVKVYKMSRYAKLVRVWWVGSFLLGTYAAVAAILDVIDSHKVSVTMVLSIASWPVYTLLLCTCFKGQSKVSMELRSEEEPLLGRSQSANGQSGIREKVSPFATAGVLSRISFWWLNPLLSSGYRKPLEQADIPRLGKEDAAEENYENFAKALRDQESSQKPFSVFWALAACYWKPMAYNGLFALGKSITVSLGPVVLKTFIDYTGGKRLFRYEGIVLVGALFLAKFLESISQRQWYFGSRRVGLQVRSALMAFIYRKDLRLSNAGRQRHAAGEVVNYMAVDAYRIGEFLYWMHFSWTTALQICIALVILSYAVGWATLAGLAVILTSMAVNTPLARSQNKYQTELMSSRDACLRATTEALRNMKILKLQAWEDRFKEQILKLREVEMNWLSKVLFRRAYNTVVFWLSPVFVSTATFTACLFLGTPLNASNVFTALATLRIIQEPIRLIPDMVATVIQVRISLARIAKFLQEDELEPDAVFRNDSLKTSDYAVELEQATLSWDPDSGAPTLKNLSVKIKRGQRVAVCGAVGCGKSSFIQAILGEMPKLSGSICVNGTVAYVAQSAWIRSGTFRDNILFGKPMDKELYSKTLRACALDKDIESFPYGDLTEIGERGMNMSGGQKQRMQLARAVYQDADVYLLDDPLSAVDAHTAASLFNGCIMEALEGKTVVLVTHQVEFLPAVDSILLLREGEIWQAGPYNELRSTGTAFEELVTAHEEAMGGNYELSSTTQGSGTEQLQRMPSRSQSRREEDAMQLARAKKNASQLTEQEEKVTGNTGLKAYLDYLRQANGLVFLSLSFSTQLVFVLGQVASNWWMASEVGNPAISTSKLLFIYSTIALTTGSFVFLRSAFLAMMGVAASRSFFAGMINSLFRAPMAFFDSTPTGRILSRVSSDFSILDMDVAFAFGFAAAASMNALTNFAVNASITWQILFVVFPFAYAARKLQLYYLASSRQLMRINGTTKAPIVNHFAEAIAGGSTIRAFKKESDFAVENLCLIDTNASPFFHSFGAIEWLILRLEFLSATVLVASALFIVLLPEGHIDPGFAGLAISYGLSLNLSVVFSVQHQCNLSNIIISAERIKQYMSLPSEAPAVIDEKRPSLHWPSVGKVELENLQVRYRPNSPLVLRGITCTFEGGQRVGVVGRTGSGKTTLISSLFRLVEPAGGRIIIDGIDISNIGLHDLRTRLGIIPQEPTLFRGTVRFNLDPVDEHSDPEVWEALDKCQLGDIIRAKPERLDAPVSDDGENWSVGQRQLFCLGRALLKRSRVLVLDEATASIDNNTDAILQRILRREFSDCTVVTVAHRIPTVIDSDMVLALHDGKMAEFDQPKKLLENSSSFFARLVAEYWANSHH
ncbi:hypothetical protein KC19_6G208800 [Ceratodon purpureus]|uniref:ABC transporter C family member 10 n=1 Tax=Ceratodon purpureus TaxID=3225 RepID=A0A8T0HJV3_CERPU|nr:hypothetical protein KC19_6G208800 [Ceratodon purpureus]